jgi:hypothetical protein
MLLFSTASSLADKSPFRLGGTSTAPGRENLPRSALEKSYFVFHVLAADCSALRLQHSIRRIGRCCGTTARPCTASDRYDETQPRDMRRTTVAGDAPTVAQQATE